MNSTMTITDTVTLRTAFLALEAETRACEPETREDYWNARYAIIVENIEDDYMMDVAISYDQSAESKNFWN